MSRKHSLEDDDYDRRHKRSKYDSYHHHYDSRRRRHSSAAPRRRKFFDRKSDRNDNRITRTTRTSNRSNRSYRSYRSNSRRAENNHHNKDYERELEKRYNHDDYDRYDENREGGGGGGGGRGGSRDHQKKSPTRSYTSTNSSSVDDEIGHYYGEIGDVIDERYEIKELLGKGTFGKVFKCKDFKYEDSVALKVVRKIERYIDSAKIEADILKNIFDQQEKYQKNLCVKMFSSFDYEGYYVMVFERLGLSLYDLIKRNDYKRFPLHVVRQVAKQTLQAMEFLQSINLIHTDLKLENILFVHNTLITEQIIQNHERYDILIPQNTRIKIIDFGGATYDHELSKATVVNTRQYRGPEVILELGWSFPSDIWSVGCIIAEIYGGDLLFQTHEELEHLALIEKLCGTFPSSMVEQSRHQYKYFDSSNYVQVRRLSAESQDYLEKFPSSFEGIFSLSEDDRESGIIELVRDLLIIDPKRRVSASSALSYRFCE